MYAGLLFRYLPAVRTVHYPFTLYSKSKCTCTYCSRALHLRASAEYSTVGLHHLIYNKIHSTSTGMPIY